MSSSERNSFCIAEATTHPSHIFSLLPLGRRLQSLRARTSRLMDSFTHQAELFPALPHPLPAPCTVTHLSALRSSAHKDSKTPTSLPKEIFTLLCCTFALLLCHFYICYFAWLIYAAHEMFNVPMSTIFNTRNACLYLTCLYHRRLNESFSIN